MMTGRASPASYDPTSLLGSPLYVDFNRQDSIVTSASLNIPQYALVGTVEIGFELPQKKKSTFFLISILGGTANQHERK